MAEDARRTNRLRRARKAAVLPRRAPDGERSEAMVTCLLDATVRVLEQDGWNALSTNRVAKVAGVSVGTLYRYFPNRDALARGLVQRAWNDELGLLAGGPDGPPTLRELLSAYVRLVARSPKFYAEWTTHLVHLVAEDARPWDAAAISAAVAAFDREYEDDPRKALACEILYVSVLHVVRRAALVSPASLVDGSLERELLVLVDTYLSSFQKRAP